MKANMTSKTVTLRLAPGEYANATTLAKRKNLSINKLFIEAMNTLDRIEREKQLYDDFTRIGSMPELAEVEFARAAQAEIVAKT
jgi:hypothetical protein